MPSDAALDVLEYIKRAESPELPLIIDMNAAVRGNLPHRKWREIRAKQRYLAYSVIESEIDMDFIKSFIRYAEAI